MNDYPLMGDDSAPARLARQDHVCDRFEAAWKAGQWPCLERYLDTLPPSEQPELLGELLGLELTYRYQNGEKPELEEYHRRFPTYGDLIDTVVREVWETTPKNAQPALQPVEQGFEEVDGTVPEPAPPSSETAGLTVLGDYELLEQLGKGGMGVVYRARQRSANRIVALKVIRPDRLEELPAEERQDWFERFRREAQIGAALEHDCAVTVYEVGHVGGQHFYSMRFVEGQSLAEILCNGPVANDRAALYLEQVARALHALHLRGIVHRDLKPRNILVDANDRPFVTDFGLAKWSEYAQDLTHLGACLGTPEYMAPEQGRNPAGVRADSDIYSLGATLYALLTGRPPFQAADPLETLRQVRDDEPLSPRRLNPAVHRDLELICLKCLEKEPRKRYPSALQVAEELRRYRSGEPLRYTRAVGKAERAWRWCRRKPALAVASSLALAALMATVIVSVDLVVYESKVIRDKQIQLAESALNNGLIRCLDGNVSEGMLGLAHSMELSPDDEPGLNWLNRINLAGWRRLLSPLKEVFPHGEKVLAIAFSRDGQTILTASSKQVVLWEAGTGYPIGPPLALPGEVLSAAFSSDGSVIMTGNADHEVRQFETATGNPIGEPLQLRGQVKHVAFSRKGKRALAAISIEEGKHEVQLWDLTTGRPTGQPLLHEQSVTAVVFSPDGKMLLTGSGNIIHTWDPTTGKRVGELRGQEGQVTAIAYSPDGMKILVGTSEKMVRLWEVDSGTPVGLPLRHQGMITSLAFSPDGNFILTGSTDKTARLWEAAPTEFHRASLLHEGVICAAAFSPSGKLLVTGSADNTARVWDVATGKLSGHPLKHAGMVLAVTFGHDDKMVLTGSEDKTAQLWEVTTGTPRGDPLQHQNPVSAVALSRDGQTALTGSCGEKSAQLWNALTGKSIGLPLPHRETVYRVAFSHDGKTILTASADATAKLWDTTTYLPTTLEHGSAVFAAVFSPDDRLVLTGSADNSAQLWHAVTGARHGQALQHDDTIHAVAFSRDSRYCATASRDKSAQLWQTSTATAVGQTLQHRGGVRSVDFSPDGRLVLTGSEDRTARLWDVPTGKQCGPPLQHADIILVVAFSPDGKTIATGSFDKTARLWDVPVPVEGTAERIGLWTKVITGMELDGIGVARVLDFDTWQRYRQRLQEQGGDPQH